SPLEDKFRYDAEMESNALIIFIAGSVPICKAMSSCAYFLAKYPDIQKNARSEVDAALARDGKLTYDNVSSMLCLKKVLLESLRYTSSAFGFNTRITGQEHSYKGLIIPKGVTVVVPRLVHLHNDPDLFSKPEIFDPERFDGKGKSAKDAAALQVFNNGLGTCVGMKLGDRARDGQRTGRVQTGSGSNTSQGRPPGVVHDRKKLPEPGNMDQVRENRKTTCNNERNDGAN
ncbi:unnamed protein product, partial [Ixodes hexagonus]